MAERNSQNYEELKKVTTFYKSLDIQSNPYVFNDGSKKELLNLKGTIRITFKGSAFNIPIRIWIMDTYPNHAPICYVEPTPEMFIKPSRYVDQNGKIYLPYLHEWNPRTSELTSLIQILILTFSEMPPLYTKPAMPYPPNQNPSSFTPGYSYMPFPTPTPSSNINPYPNYTAMPQPTPYSVHPAPTGTITDQHIRDSLISAIEDKLRRKMREVFLQNEAELETLKKTKQDLLQGRQKIQDILGKLQSEKTELERNLKVVEGKSEELDKLIEKLNEQGTIDVDDAVIATTPLFTQMLHINAEESAIEDTIYYLDEGLRRGVIDLETFLKQVRYLSHKQFMLRALMKKCRQTVG